MKAPFSIYDFFAYLAPGFLLLVSIDFIFFGLKYSAGFQEHVVVAAIALMTAAYVTGHVIDTASYMAFEFFNKELSPRATIFNRSQLPWLINIAYHPQFSESFWALIKSRTHAEGAADDASSSFDCAFSAVFADEKAAKALSTYETLYGFARNVAFTSFVIAVMALFAPPGVPRWQLFSIACFVGLVLTLRYLRFYHDHTRNLYLLYWRLVAPRHSEQRGANDQAADEGALEEAEGATAT
jgi:hypothetical protein